MMRMTGRQAMWAGHLFTDLNPNKKDIYGKANYGLSVFVFCLVKKTKKLSKKVLTNCRPSVIIYNVPRNEDRDAGVAQWQSS